MNKAEIYTRDEGLSHLIPLVQNGNLIVMAGSGVSVPPPSLLPTWDGLLDQFIKFCESLQPLLPVDQQFDELLVQARNHTEKYPMRVASVLKARLGEIDQKDVPNISNVFRKWFTDLFSKALPNENHEMLATTAYPYILTTNYDNLLEDAAQKAGLYRLAVNSFTYDNPEKVASAIYNNVPGIIHLHGNILDIAFDKVVFTAEDYVSIRQDHPGFTLSIQNLFMRYCVLFVGYGGSDPHLEDLLEQLSAYYKWPRFPDFPLRSFIVLRKDKVDDLLAHYKLKTRTHIIALDDYAETPSFLRVLKAAKPRS